MTDFVYVYSRLGAVGDEILTSIKSVRKFFSGECRVFVVGDDPKIPGIIHLPAERIGNTRFPKAKDAARKLDLIAHNPDISEDFIYMYDDIVLLRKCRREDFEVVIAVDYVSKIDTYWDGKRKPSSVWRTVFMSTIHTLRNNGLPTWNYETHLPRMLNKEKVAYIIKTFDLIAIPHLFATLYFNFYHKAPYETLDDNESVKMGLYSPHEKRWIDENLPGHLFLNYDNCGYTEYLREYLKKLTA